MNGKLKRIMALAISLTLLMTVVTISTSDDVEPMAQPNIISTYPVDGATNVDHQLNPFTFEADKVVCNVTVEDPEGDSMDVTFATNATGSWTNTQTNSSVGNGTYRWHFTNCDTAGTQYWWRVYVDDGTTNVSETYSFTTVGPADLKIQNSVDNQGFIDLKKGEHLNLTVYVETNEMWIDTVEPWEITFTHSLLEGVDSDGNSSNGNVTWGDLFYETLFEKTGTWHNDVGILNGTVRANGDTNTSGDLMFFHFDSGEGTGTAYVNMTVGEVGVAFTDNDDPNTPRTTVDRPFTVSNLSMFIHYYVPTEPSSFTATTVSQTQIDLSWVKDTTGDYGVDPDDGVGEYVYIERNTVSSWSMGDGTEVYNGTGTSFSDTNIVQGTQYWYQAWSFNETDSLFSTAYSSDTDTTQSLTPPGDVVVEPYDGVMMNLSWTVVDADSDYTYIERRTTPGPWSIGDGTVAYNDTGSSFTDTNLAHNTTYYYQIWSWDEDDGIYSDTFSSGSNTTTVLLAPTGMTADWNDPNKNTQIDLTWTNADGFDSTYIERNTVSTWNMGEGNEIYNGSGTSFTDTGLLQNTQYWYRAWSYNVTEGFSSAFDSATNTTDDFIQPTDVSVTPDDGIKMDLSWTVANKEYIHFDEEAGSRIDLGGYYHGNKQSIKLNQTDLQGYNNKYLTSVKIYAESRSDVDLEIWEGGSKPDGYCCVYGGTEGTQLIQQPIEDILSEGAKWYNIHLNEPIKIDSSTHYWIVVDTHDSGEYFTVYRDNGAVSTGFDRSNWLAKHYDPPTGRTCWLDKNNYDGTDNDAWNIRAGISDDIDSDYVYVERNSAPDWTRGDGTEVCNLTLSTTTFKDDNLDHNTTYYYQFWNYNATQNIYSDLYAEGSNTTTVLLSPTGLSVVQNTSKPHTQLDLSWTNADGIDSTYIERYSSETWVLGTGTWIYNGTLESFTDTGLDQNTQYFYQAWSWNDTEGFSGTYDEANTTTDDFVPPTGFTATAQGDATIQLSWTVVDADSDYTVIERNTAETWVMGAGTEVYNDTGSSYLDDDVVLDHSTQYFYQAWAYNVTQFIYSDNYAETNETTSDLVAPSSLTVIWNSSAEHTVQDISWVNNEADADATVLEYMEGSGSSWNPGEGTELYNDSGLSFVHSGLTQNTLYRYQVWSWNESEGIYSPLFDSAENTTADLISPTDFTASVIDWDGIGLSWTIADDDSDTTYIERNTISSWSIGDGTTIVYNDTGTSYDDTGLDSKTQYYYQAWAYNATENIYSTLYSSDNDTTLNTPPVKPTNVYPTDNSPYCSVYPTYKAYIGGVSDQVETDNLTVYAEDPDGDNLVVEFYWSDGELIGTVSVSSGTNAVLYLDGNISADKSPTASAYQWLEHDSTYTWYAIANDTAVNPSDSHTNTSDSWDFDTSHYSDINENGEVDYLDVSNLASHYRDSTLPGEEGWDMNNDGISNYLDVSGLVTDYGNDYHTW